MSEPSAHLSGKWRQHENFPVASLLIAARHRAPILAFYRFARTADDIADDAALAAADKVALLDRLQAALTGDGPADPAAEPLRRALAECGLGPTHALDLVDAFRRDARQSRYSDWSGLIDYCRQSAMPVGRFVLDVHGEDRGLWPASDALCAALQIVNHLQDCGADYRRLDRVYLPLDVLARHGAAVEMLGESALTPPLRAALGELIDRCRALLTQSEGFERRAVSRRLGAEIAVIRALAVAQLTFLESHDPLAGNARPARAARLWVAGRTALARVLRSDDRHGGPQRLRRAR